MDNYSFLILTYIENSVQANFRLDFKLPGGRNEVRWVRPAFIIASTKKKSMKTFFYWNGRKWKSGEEKKSKSENSSASLNPFFILHKRLEFLLPTQHARLQIDRDGGERKKEGLWEEEIERRGKIDRIDGKRETWEEYRDSECERERRERGDISFWKRKE